MFKGISDSIPRSSTGQQGVPGRLRVADIDLDGFADVVVTLAFSDETKTPPTPFTATVILQNKEVDGKRTLAQIKSTDDSYYAKIIQIADLTTELVTFIDIDEDGKLDFII